MLYCKLVREFEYLSASLSCLFLLRRELIVWFYLAVVLTINLVNQ